MTDQPSRYGELGVSATKGDVHRAVAGTDPGIFPTAFCRIGPDVLAGDPDWCSAIHSDDAGTKAIVAYLAYRESGDASLFRGIAHDALVMNLDDLACVGASGPFLLGNTINRNSFRVPGEVVAEIVAGYADSVATLAELGIAITPTGGETADMNDAVRTILVGATLAARLPRASVIDNGNIRPGDAIVGLSSTGRAAYESAPNSGIGDNGLTLARHALLAPEYGERFAESVDSRLGADLAYRGRFKLADRPEGLGMTIGEALLSPTRTYAPIVAVLRQRLGAGRLHGAVHCTGGGQSKCLGFGSEILYRKNNLFPIPPIFELIAAEGRVDWSEMYRDFNMGHRMELFVDPGDVPEVQAVARSVDVDAWVVGRCEESPARRNRLVIEGEKGSFEYQAS